MLPHYRGKDLRFTFHHQVRPFIMVNGLSLTTLVA